MFHNLLHNLRCGKLWKKSTYFHVVCLDIFFKFAYSNLIISKLNY